MTDPPSHTGMTKSPFNYPPGTTPEAIEAFRTMFGQTPEDDIRLSSTFETFLKGFVSGAMSIYLGILDSLVVTNCAEREEIQDMKIRIDNLVKLKSLT